MVVFSVILLTILTGLMISLVLPEGLSDINIGFYMLISALFAFGAMSVLLRKKWSFFKSLSEYVVIILSLAIIAEGVLIYFSASENPKGNEQAIVVCGSGLFVESRMTTELEKRMDKALELHMDYPGLPIILSGGTDDPLTHPQCVAMQSYLEKKATELNIPIPKTISDDTSTGLYDNISSSLEKSGVQSAFLIVSRHNVARTKIITNRISPDSTVIGTDYPVSKYIIYYIRELGYGLKTLVCDGII